LVGKSSAGLGGLYDFEQNSKEESKRHSGKRHTHRSRKSMSERSPICERDVKSISKILPIPKNTFELDSNPIYELDGRNKTISNVSIKELDGRSIYELEGEKNLGYSKKGYIPYRPKTVENVWSPEYYDKFNPVERREVDRVEKVNNTAENFYTNPKITHSTLLGEIDRYSPTRSDMIRNESYRKGFFDGVERFNQIPKPSRKEKFVGMVLDRILK
jgi:hypothetical protein